MEHPKEYLMEQRMAWPKVLLMDVLMELAVPGIVLVGFCSDFCKSSLPGSTSRVMQ